MCNCGIITKGGGIGDTLKSSFSGVWYALQLPYEDNTVSFVYLKDNCSY